MILSRRRGRMPLITALMAVAVLTLVSACSSGGGGGGDDDGDGGTNTPPPAGGGPTPIGNAMIQRFAATVGATGRASVTFTLPGSSNKFTVVVEVPSGQTAFVTVERDGGVNYIAPGGVEISLAGDPAPIAKAANAPSRDFDPPVLDTATYTATALGNPGDTVNFSVVSRGDANFGSGVLAVNVYLVGASALQEDTRAAIDQALVGMTQIMARAGITLNISQFTVDASELLPDPTEGSTFYRSATSGAPTPAVNLFIGGDVSVGGIDDSSTLGISADIPGPPISTDRSAVALSLAVSAGPDGIFSADETRLFGETCAHEVGHFMGLFHPVDIVGVSVAFSDPLPDTDDCSATTDCLNNDNLIRNLMFPFPVPDDTNADATIPQNRLTPQQAGVLNLYGAVE